LLFFDEYYLVKFFSLFMTFSDLGAKCSHNLGLCRVSLIPGISVLGIELLDIVSQFKH